MPSRLLIAGASTRAAAHSAARAGLNVIAVDAYADRDQHPSVRAVAASASVGERVRAVDLVRTAAAFEADAVVYLSPFENHPGAVPALSRNRRLLGNPVAVLRRVRDPLEVARAFAQRGFQVPHVIVPPTNTSAAGTADVEHAGAGSYLLKPLASGGGHGIVPATESPSPRPGWYLQEHIDGWPGSVTFVAAQRRCVVLAVSRQLVGDAAFGASGYRYCGSIVDPTDTVDDAVRTGACALAEAAADLFDLVGVNCIDFVVREAVPVPVEINPRWSASMELVDRVSHTPIMGAHVEACAGSLLEIVPERNLGACARGKAVVFARTDVVIPPTSVWADEIGAGDVPHPGQQIATGQPICTVFGEGATRQACYRSLVTRASRVYAEIEPQTANRC
jgi:predicted ATP-grasp superfamily ATP-dependent carboligase